MPPGYDKEIDQAFTGKWRFPNGGIGSMEADMIADGGYSLPMMHEFPTLKLPKLEIKHREIIVNDSLPSDQEHAIQRIVVMWNFTLPFVYHRIDIQEQHTIRAKTTGVVVKTWTNTSYVKEYSTDDGPYSWTTYQHMLKAFVDRIRERSTPVWVEPEDSIRQMEMIDGAYKKAGLPVRPSRTAL